MRILVVEDQADIRRAAAQRIRALGHGADEAQDLGEAQSFLDTYAYDVVVLDRLLPDGDARDRLTVWRSRGLTAPVLFLTALDRVEDRVDGFEAGADDYLVKPFAMDELLARVTALARRAAAMRPSRDRIGDLEIDFGRREVRRAGILLTLRPKEFALLELLAVNRGRAVSRREILAGLWGEDHEPLSNVEEVVVAALRRKLGRPSLIRTVRGAGYLLEEPDG